MIKLKILVLFFIALMGLTNTASAETVRLAPDDFVGITFWLISMGMLAATAFFFMERSSVVPVWKTSITIAGLITGIAFIHYMFLRDIWVQNGDAPTLYRYIEWLITMPLQMVVFYFILGAVRKVSNRMFWRLLIGSLVMVVGGYLGAAEILPKMLGFAMWMAGWIYVLYEIFSGEAGRSAAKSGNKSFATAFSVLRMIVTVGWAVYPLGYVFGNITSGIDANSLNVIYNLTDLINKIAFGLVIWAAAVSSGSGGRVR